MIDTENDYLDVFRDVAGEWRWRRVDGGNHRIVSIGAEGYLNEGYCREAAAAYNPGVEIQPSES